jgi:hypothetical protein
MNKLPQKPRKPSSCEAPSFYSSIGGSLGYRPARDSPSREIETSLPVRCALLMQPNLAGSRKAPIHDSPKGSDCFGLAVKEVLEKTWLVQGSWIGITLPVFAELANPVCRLMMVDYPEEVRGIEVWPTGVIQNPKFIALHTDNNVWLTDCEIRIAWVLPPQLDNHA